MSADSRCEASWLQDAGISFEGVCRGLSTLFYKTDVMGDSIFVTLITYLIPPHTTLKEIDDASLLDSSCSTAINWQLLKALTRTCHIPLLDYYLFHICNNQQCLFLDFVMISSWAFLFCHLTDCVILSHESLQVTCGLNSIRTLHVAGFPHKIWSTL